MSTSARPSEARSVQTTWLYTLGSIVFFVVVFEAVAAIRGVVEFQIALETGDTGALTLSVALLALIAVSTAVQIRCSWFLRVGLAGGLPPLRWVLLLLVTPCLAWGLGLLLPATAYFAAIPVWTSLSLIAPLLGRRPRWGLLLAGAVVTIAHPLIADRIHSDGDLLGDFDQTFAVLYSLALPLMILTSIWWWQIVVELDHHRRAAAELAVARERLRFASDLHDIQGHQLQVIALKSELAERLIDADTDAARDNIHEVRQIARQALEETRSLVNDYRDVALSTELENAREVLSASGAACELEIAAMPEDPALQRALAFVVREATTNILRHSTAARVWIRLRDAEGGTELLVGNDGVESGPLDGEISLTGVRERIAATGGRLDVELGGGTFELRTWVPVRVVAA